jgi:glycosidase
MPGVPSIYYGSECATEGRKHNGSDAALRPGIDVASLRQGNNPLLRAIQVLASIRKSRPALRYGSYRQLHVASEQFAFLRTTGEDSVIVALNASRKPAPLRLPAPSEVRTTRFIDILNNNEPFYAHHGQLDIPTLYPCWARILVPTD